MNAPGEQKRKPLTIMNNGNNKTYVVNCEIVELVSYSSHIQHDEMLSYYSSIQCNQIVLQHGDSDRKNKFAEILEAELSKQCKTTKVILPNKKDRLEL